MKPHLPLSLLSALFACFVAAGAPSVSAANLIWAGDPVTGTGDWGGVGLWLGEGVAATFAPGDSVSLNALPILDSTTITTSAGDIAVGDLTVTGATDYIIKGSAKMAVSGMLTLNQGASLTFDGGEASFVDMSFADDSNLILKNGAFSTTKTGDVKIGLEGTGADFSSSLTVDGSSFTAVDARIVLSNWTSQGHVHIKGTSANLSIKGLYFDGWKGTLNISDGGTLTLGSDGVKLNSGPALENRGRIYFSSGTIIASTDTVIDDQVAAGTDSFFILNNAAGDDVTGKRVIDTNGHNLKMAIAVSGKGSLTKSGDGTLELKKTNSYEGGTIIEAGTVKVEANSGLGLGLVTMMGGTSAAFTTLDLGGKTIANNITLGGSHATLSGMSGFSGNLSVSGTLNLGAGFSSEQITTSHLTLAASSILQMDVNGTTYDKYTVSASGTLTLGGAVTIQLRSTDFNSGEEYVLIDATGATIDGTFNLTLDKSLLDAEVTAIGKWENNVYKVIFGGALGLLWSGGDSGVWSVNGVGWGEAGSASYTDGQKVVFDDTAANKAVTITGEVTPGNISVKNSTGDYVFQGSGKITGATGLTKTGTGTLTIQNVNEYTGGTNISGGVLAFTNGALGSGPVTLDNATLRWLGGNTQNLGSLTLNGAKPILDLGVNDVTLSSITGNFANLEKRGTGKLTLTSFNSAAGTAEALVSSKITVASGSLDISEMIVKAYATVTIDCISDAQTKVLNLVKLGVGTETGSINQSNLVINAGTGDNASTVNIGNLAIGSHQNRSVDTHVVINGGKSDDIFNSMTGNVETPTTPPISYSASLSIRGNSSLTINDGDYTKLNAKDIIVGSYDDRNRSDSYFKLNNTEFTASDTLVVLSRWNNMGHLELDGGSVLAVKGITKWGDVGASVSIAGGSRLELGSEGVKFQTTGGNHENAKFYLSNGTIKMTADTAITFSGGGTPPVGFYHLFLSNKDGSALATDSERVIDTNGHTLAINLGVAGDGSLTKRGAGTLELNYSNSYTGETIIEEGTVLAGSDTALGDGSVSLLLKEGKSGILDMGDKALGNTVNMSAGELKNAGAFAGSLNLTNVTNSVKLGGIDGSKITQLETTAKDANISGITGNISLANASLFIDTNHMKPQPEVGTTIINFADTSSTLTVTDRLNLGISSDLFDILVKGSGKFDIFLTNGVLTDIDANNVVFNMNSQEYTSGDSTGVFSALFSKDGNLTVTLNSRDLFAVTKGAEETLSVAGQDGYTYTRMEESTSVYIDGTLNLNLGKGTGTGVLSTIINNLQSSADATFAVINTTAVGATDATKTLVTLKNETADTDYRGSIRGEAQLVKTGEKNLTVGGTVAGSSLTVEGGRLTIESGLTTSTQNEGTGNVDIASATELVLGGTSNIAGTLSLADQGKLGLNKNAIVNLNGDMTGSADSLISMADGAQLIFNQDNTLGAKVDGTGTLVAGNGATLTLGDTVLSEQTTLLANKEAKISLGAGKSAKSITGEGTFELGGDFTIKHNEESTFGGILYGAGKLIYDGKGTQTLNTAGAAGVTIAQSGEGKTILKNENGDITYAGIELTKGTLQAMNTTNVDSLLVDAGTTLILGRDMNKEGVYETSVIMNSEATTLTGGSNIILGGITSGNAGTAAFSAGTVTYAGSGKVNFELGTIGEWTDGTYSLEIMKGTGISADDYETLLRGSLKNLGYVVDGIIADANGLRMNLVSSGGNGFLNFANSANTKEAANSLWNSRKDNLPTGGILNEIIGSIRDADSGMAGTLTAKEANEALASYAGSSLTTLLASQRDGLRQQVKWIRNRTAQMGVNQALVNEDMPYFNAWVQGNAAYNNVSQKGDQSGYTMNTWGGTVGFDIDLSEKWTIGSAFTANYSKLKANSVDYAKGDNDAYYANLFARFQHKKWSHTVIATGGWNDANLKRSVNIGSNSYNVKGDTTGSTYGAFYEGAYDIALNRDGAGSTILQPLFNASIYRSSMDSYTESGMGDASMRVSGMEATYGTVGLGARLSSIVGSNLFGRAALGELRVQVVQDYGDDTDTVRLCPIGAPSGGMRVKGAKVGTTGVQLGAGLVIPVGEQSSIYMDADADFRNNATVVSGNIGYRYNF